MDQGTLGKYWDGSGYLYGGPGRVEGPSQRYGTGWGTLGEVREGSGDLWGGPERVKGPSGRSLMGQETLPNVQEGRWTLGEVQDGLVDQQEGLG